MKEAYKTAGIKIAGLYPWIDSQSISGEILLHFDVNNVFLNLNWEIYIIYNSLIYFLNL